MILGKNGGLLDSKEENCDLEVGNTLCRNTKSVRLRRIKVWVAKLLLLIAKKKMKKNVSSHPMYNDKYILTLPSAWIWNFDKSYQGLGQFHRVLRDSGITHLSFVLL